MDLKLHAEGEYIYVWIISNFEYGTMDCISAAHIFMLHIFFSFSFFELFENPYSNEVIYSTLTLMAK